MRNKSKLSPLKKKAFAVLLFFMPLILFEWGCAAAEPGRGSEGDEYSGDEYSREELYADESAVLDNYGEWIMVPFYGTVWRPFVSEGWRPYFYGNWIRTENDWTWVSYEPYGWIVYHYGYWDYMPETGWFWIESRDWSPANVEWLNYGEFIGWAPLPPPGADISQSAASQINIWNFVETRYFTQDNVGRYRLRRNPEPFGTNLNQAPDIRTVEIYSNRPVRVVRAGREKVRADGRQFDRLLLPEAEAAAAKRYESRIVGSVVRTRDDPRTIDQRNNPVGVKQRNPGSDGNQPNNRGTRNNDPARPSGSGRTRDNDGTRNTGSGRDSGGQRNDTDQKKNDPSVRDNSERDNSSGTAPSAAPKAVKPVEAKDPDESRKGDRNQRQATPAKEKNPEGKSRNETGRSGREDRKR